MAPKKKPDIVRPTERQAVIEAIVQSLRFLAGRCDWAATRDDQGFNQPDAGNGHGLADQSFFGPLTTGQLIVGYLLLKKYDRTQLLPNGFVLPAPETVAALFGDLQAGKDDFRGAIRWSEQYQQLLVTFPFSNATNRLMIRIIQRYGGTGRQKNQSGYGYYWLINRAGIHALCEACPEFDLSEEVQELRRTTPVDQPPAPQPVVASDAHPIRVVRVPAPPRPLGVIVLEQGQIGIRLMDIWKDQTKARNAIETIKALRSQWGGSGWSGPETKTWYLDTSAAKVITELFPNFEVSDEVRTLAPPATNTDGPISPDDAAFLALVE